MSSPRLGITGARGVLGRSLLASWPAASWHLYSGDIRNGEDVREWLATTPELDGVVHLAALVPTKAVEADPLRAFETNVAGTCNLLDALRGYGRVDRTPWLFHASTSHVYRSSDSPLGEDSPLEPFSLYGRTKLQAEEWCEIHRTRYGVPICLGRIFSYASPLQDSGYFIPATIRKIREAPPGAALEIPGLLGSRDFLSTGEISRAIGLLFESRAQGVFNIGSGLAQSLLEVVNRIRERLGREDVRIVPLEIGPSNLVADVSSLKARGIELVFDLDRLLAEMGI